PRGNLIQHDADDAALSEIRITLVSRGDEIVYQHGRVQAVASQRARSVEGRVGFHLRTAASASSASTGSAAARSAGILLIISAGQAADSGSACTGKQETCYQRHASKQSRKTSAIHRYTFSPK